MSLLQPIMPSGLGQHMDTCVARLTGVRVCASSVLNASQCP